MIKKSTDQRGISLIELLVAAVILGIGVAAFANVLANIRGTTDDYGDRRRALALAEQKIEILKHAGFYSTAADTNLSLIPDNVPDNPNTYPADLNKPEKVQIGSVTGARIWTVTGIDDPLDGQGLPGDADADLIDYKQITVTVNWANNSGDNQIVRLSTFIAKR